MSLHFKAAGLAVIAVLALSAGTASAVDFHSEVGTHTLIYGEQHAGEDTLTFNAGNVRCNQVKYSGYQGGATRTTLPVTPTYVGCTAFGFVNAPVDNSCLYTFDSNGNNVDIFCPGSPITVTAFNCWVTVGSQENIGPVTYTNQGAGTSRDFTIDMNITGIKYTQHSKSFPGCTNGTFTNGTYTGSATVKGANTAGTQVGIWVQ